MIFQLPLDLHHKQLTTSKSGALLLLLHLVSHIIYINNAVLRGYVKEVTSPIKLVKMSKKLEDPCNYNPRQKPICIGCVQHV
jgi:hypothetical protein